MKTLATELRKSRNKRKLTIEFAAHCMGIPKSSLCDYENGHIKNPSVLTIRRMTEFYRWSPNTLHKIILN